MPEIAKLHFRLANVAQEGTQEQFVLMYKRPGDRFWGMLPALSSLNAGDVEEMSRALRHTMPTTTCEHMLEGFTVCPGSTLQHDKCCTHCHAAAARAYERWYEANRTNSRVRL